MRAEWEMNRFYKTLVDNTPSEDTDGYDIEFFPIESITKPWRPRKSGIVKAMVGNAVVEPARYDAPPGVRYYTVDADDEYKYWQSPYPSDTAGNMSNCSPQVLYYQEDGTTPRTVKTNKISFVVENTYSYPVTYKVQTKASGAASWVDAASNVAIPASGKVDLWWSGSAWTTTPNYSTANVRDLHGVRLVVTKMYVPAASRVVSSKVTAGTDIVTAAGGAYTPADIGAAISGTGIPSGTVIKSVTQRETRTRNTTTVNGKTVVLAPTVNYYADARLSKTATSTSAAANLTVSVAPVGTYFNLISLGFNLELDVTADVVTWNDTFSMGEDDFITPLGTISSNNGSVTLFDDANTYDNDNPASMLYGILDKGVIFRAYMKYGSDLVQEFELYSDTWESGESDTVVSLIDGTTLFMSVKPRPVLYRDIPVQEAIWRICDIIGFNNYQVTAVNTKPHAVIDIFWTDGEKTAWEIFQELSRATQTAIYFDAYGVLQVKTRNSAFDQTATPVYDFIRDSVPGGQPSNVVSLSDQNEYQANKVTVNWTPTEFSERRDNIVPFEVVWEPDSTVVLRSTPLAKNLLVGDTTITLPTKEGKTWPWSGMCNIEGEYISFDAKRYVYYDASGARQTTWVTDKAQQSRLDEATPIAKRHLNTYTGILRVKERGLWNTEEKNHYIDMNGWTKGRQRDYGSTNSPAPGIKLNGKDSTITLQSPKNSDMKDYTYLYRGNAANPGYWYLGTRLRIDKSSHKDKVGGIFFNADNGLGTGYFLEVMATARMNGKMRHTRNEVVFYSMKPDGSKKQFGGEKLVMKDKSKNHKKNAKTKKDIGAELAVPMDRWIDFDIWFEVKGNGDHSIQIWANGSYLFEAIVPNGSGWQHNRVERFGLFARGHSSVTFDYVYAINNLGVDPIDGESYFDRIEGAYRGNQIEKDWTHETRKVRRKIKKKWTKVKVRYTNRYYDEFGPMVHELREFKIKFTSDTPVLQSKLYLSNRTQAVPAEYVGDISGAHFVLANISRQDAIISGDDETTAMGNGTINHKLFVYGRPAIQKDAQQIEKTDDWSIRRRGIIEVEYDSPWTQNETEANNLADWLVTNWSNSDAKVEIEVFGNPLLELTDIVTLTYKNMTNVKFYVIGINNSYEGGLSTTLTLRRVV
jgi:hypothetical protein